MNGNDLMLSIKCAIYEEQKKAYNNMEYFKLDDITIMATAKAICMIITKIEPCFTYYTVENTKCFGCNLKMIDGADAEVYLARKIPIITAKLSKEESEEGLRTAIRGVVYGLAESVKNEGSETE